MGNFSHSKDFPFLANSSLKPGFLVPLTPSNVCLLARQGKLMNEYFPINIFIPVQISVVKTEKK